MAGAAQWGTQWGTTPDDDWATLTAFHIATLTSPTRGVRPEAPAVITGDEVCTYAQLEVASNQVANGLLALGVQPRQRVAILSKNSRACLEIMLGACKAGIVPTLLNWRLHPSELEYVLNDSTAPVLFVADEFASASGAARSDRATLVIGEGGDYAAWLRDQSSAAQPGIADDSEVAVQLYTSGTTGHPKGAMLTHGGFAVAMPDAAEFWGLHDHAVMLSVLPMFHIAGVGTALAALWKGAAVVIENDASSAATLADVQTFGVTHIVLASVMLQMLVSDPGFADADLSTLETISYGAAPITQQVLEDALAGLDCRLMQPYGLTETTGVLTLLTDEDHRRFVRGDGGSDRLRSCGRARPDVELRVVEPSTGVDVGVGEAGELWARAPRIMTGYWNLPDATAEVLEPGGWFRTGDIAVMDEDGYVFLRDRLKDMIISGGENVYPVEVENALQWHPAVAEVAVIGVPHEKWGETPLAIVVAVPGAEITGSELIDFARSRIARYKCPTRVEFVSELPRNATGKVLRKELRKDPRWLT